MLYLPKSVFMSVCGPREEVAPFFVLGRELMKRGHSVTIGASPDWATQVESLGFQWLPIGPSVEAIGGDPDREASLEDPIEGRQWFFDHWLLPHLHEMTRDTLNAMADYDLVVTHPYAFHGMIAARKSGKPWVSTALSPSQFQSEHEPPVPVLPISEALPSVGPLSQAWVRSQIRAVSERYNLAILKVAGEFGEAVWPTEPLSGGGASATLHLALMSRQFIEPQRDWPRQTMITGFVYDDAPVATLDESFMQWLEMGGAPLAVYLGDSLRTAHPGVASMAMDAARTHNRRVVVLDESLTEPVAPVLAGGPVYEIPASWAGTVLPKCAGVVHGASVGVIAEVARSGVAGVCIPVGAVEEDHARRLAGFGGSAVLPRVRLSAERLEQGVQLVLAERDLAGGAKLLQHLMKYEMGSVIAVDGIECVLLGDAADSKFDGLRTNLPRAALRAMWQERNARAS